MDLLSETLRQRFGLSSFRPGQRDVCAVVADGGDALVVMPTGAGKSLCYQLPGLVRGGTTLVVSPLISLMEDQVAKLQALGLAAERIHSGRGRSESRQVCRSYLDGQLDFLFIAPERLGVQGFPELLAKRRLALVAIDEAHCISHWGHDFRPDYRLLGERLPALRPAPVVALTATATPRVQEDVLAQLGMAGARRFIRGFRRDNLAVEVADLAPDRRTPEVLRLLADPARRPAIVYAPRRKDTEELADALADVGPAAAYHAGLVSGERDRVQTAFLGGELEVVVATIAFGMGIDKPDVRTVLHTGLPGSVEGYYQEIGRAGRDGAPARAVLLCSWADRKVHDYFLDRNYPATEQVERVFAALGNEPRPVAGLLEASGLAPEVAATALTKLVIHGGAKREVDASGEPTTTRGSKAWRRSYEAQREHRLEQIERMVRFTAGGGCRMLDLVAHFGDREDSGRPCGICDECAPHDCCVRSFRPPRAAERRRLSALLRALDYGPLTPRQLAANAPELGGRDTVEALLAACARARLVRLVEESFEQDGRTIVFRRARLTTEGRRARAGRGPGVESVLVEGAE